MRTKKPYRGYYLGLTWLLIGSFVVAEASLYGALYYSTALPDPSRENQSVLLLLLVPLGILLLPSLWRTLSASNAGHAPEVVHQALTPERIYILGCSLFALTTLMSPVVAFDPTIWGLLLSVAVIGPLVSYAQHVGELRSILKPREHDTAEERWSQDPQRQEEDQAWRAHLQDVHRMNLRKRVRGKFPPLPRELTPRDSGGTTFRTNVEDPSATVGPSVNT